jgi:hypothetical protein
MQQESRENLKYKDAVRLFIDAGYSDATFRRYVKEGAIKGELPSNRQRGALYPVEDVLAALSAQKQKSPPQQRQSSRAKAEVKQPATEQINPIQSPEKKEGRVSELGHAQAAVSSFQRYEVDIARDEDVPLIFVLERRFEQERVVNPLLLSSWLRKNKCLYWILFDPEDRSKVRGVFGVIPLREELIQRLVNGEITPNDISPDDLLIYQPGERYSCYVTSATAERQISLMPLMHQIFSTWSEASIQIDKIYASEPYGLYETSFTQVAAECFFSPFREEESRIVWRLRLDRTNAAYPAFIQSYQKNIQEKRGLQSMEAVLDKVAPQARVGGLKDRSRLQSRYRLGERGYMAPNVRFRPAETYEDVLAVIQINNDLFGKSKDVSDDEFVRHRLGWLEQNPEVIHVLEVDKKIVGFVSLFPLSAAVMNGVLNNKIRMSQIQSGDIQRYVPGRDFDVFVWTVGVDRNIQGQRKLILGAHLVAGIWNLFNEWGERGIQIRSVHARSDEVDGINISRELGLHPVPPPPGVEKAVFEIRPMEETEQPFLIQYQRGLAEYNRKHGIAL